MKKNTCIIVLLILNFLIPTYGQSMEGSNQILKGAQSRSTDFSLRSNQSPPELTAKLYEPNLISTNAHEHSSPAFSPDGNQVFWSIYSEVEKDLPQKIMYMKKIENKWTEPKVAGFSGQYNDGGPCFSYDGNKLFFYSNRPIDDRPVNSHELWHKNYHIWYIEKENDIWSEPKRLSFTHDPEYSALQQTISRSGNLYFIAEYDGVEGNYGIYKSEYTDMGYEKPVALNTEINSNVYDWTPFIAADESYFIFSSYKRAGGYGECDLYICFKLPDNSWSSPMNMGDKVNSAGNDRFPIVTHDGKYLFFTRYTENNMDDVFWISSEIIDILYKSFSKTNE